MKRLMILAVVLGCGGHKTADTTQGEENTPSVAGMQSTGDSTDHSGAMIPPDKMDEVQNDLKRKSMVVSRCLADAVEAGDVKKNTHGKITLEFVVSTGGKAENIKVVKSDIDAQSVQDCTKKHVAEIEFPQLPHPYETSYTYAMEAD